MLSPVRLPPSRRNTATTARAPTTTPPADRIRPLQAIPIAEPAVRQTARSQVPTPTGRRAIRPIDRPAGRRPPPPAIPRMAAGPTPLRATPPGPNDGIPAAAPQAATTIQRAARPRPGAPLARLQPTRRPMAVCGMAAARDPTTPRLLPTDIAQTKAVYRVAPPVRPSKIGMQMPSPDRLRPEAALATVPPVPARGPNRRPFPASERRTYRARPTMTLVTRATGRPVLLPINRRPEITPCPAQPAAANPATRQAASTVIGPTARTARVPWAIPVRPAASRAPLTDTSCPSVARATFSRPWETIFKLTGPTARRTIPFSLSAECDVGGRDLRPMASFESITPLADVASRGVRPSSLLCQNGSFVDASHERRVCATERGACMAIPRQSRPWT